MRSVPDTGVMLEVIDRAWMLYLNSLLCKMLDLWRWSGVVGTVYISSDSKSIYFRYYLSELALKEQDYYCILIDNHNSDTLPSIVYHIISTSPKS